MSPLEEVDAQLDEARKYRDSHTCPFSVPSFSFLEGLYQDFRTPFALNYSWAIPSLEALEKISEFVGSNHVTEVGAGLGLWARLLSDMGVQITAFDIRSKQENWVSSQREPWLCPVMCRDQDDLISKARNVDVLMLVWPCYDEPWAHDYLSAFNPKKVIYIGEGFGGCTADDQFHRVLFENYEYTEVRIPQWDRIHDSVHLCTRKV